MQSADLLNGYEIIELSKVNDSSVEALCNKCSDYYILSGGALPSKDNVNALFSDLLPNKNFEDKFLLGVYKFKKLIGIIDIIRDFPTRSEWTIGLLLLEPEERGKGLGIIIHEGLAQWAMSLGAKVFRVGVVEDNNRAFKFWSNLGYAKIKEININIGAKNQVVNCMMVEL